MSSEKRTVPPARHPARRSKEQGTKWSWNDAAKYLGISVRQLKKNYNNLPDELAIKLEEFINGN